VVGRPKTDAGVRTVSIPATLLPAVREHLLRHGAPGEDGLLFPSDGDPAVHLSETTLNGRAAVVRKDATVVRAGFGWREARRRAGRSDLTHDLRHTGASLAGEEGASMAELMYRLGHSTPAMAMRYQHSRLERDRDLGRRLAAVLSGRLIETTAGRLRSTFSSRRELHSACFHDASSSGPLRMVS
jgi:integrase